MTSFGPGASLDVHAPPAITISPLATTYRPFRLMTLITDHLLRSTTAKSVTRDGQDESSGTAGGKRLRQPLPVNRAAGSRAGRFWWTTGLPDCRANSALLARWTPQSADGRGHCRAGSRSPGA